MQRVYLAGGLRSGWQQTVIDECAGHAEFFNPATAEFQGKPLDEIAMTEINWLQDADVVFAYLERDNPSGLGMSAEIGYAAALDLHIIFVDERDDQHTAWLRCLCDYSTASFEEGLTVLYDLLARRS